MITGHTEMVGTGRPILGGPEDSDDGSGGGGGGGFKELDGMGVRWRRDKRMLRRV